MQLSARRAAEIAITVQFLALVRTLAEIFRLRAVGGPAFGLADAVHYVAGGLIAAVGAWCASTCYFLGWYRSAVAVVGVAVLAMITYKILVIG